MKKTGLTVPGKLNRALRFGACSPLHRFEWRSSADRQSTVGRQCQVARTVSKYSTLDGSKPRMDDRCGRGGGRAQAIS